MQTLRRRLLGIIALTLIVVGVIGRYFGGDSATVAKTFFEASIKSGLVLAALWLAFPRIIDLTDRIPPWLLGAVIVGGLAVAVRPRNVVIVAPLLLVLFLMHGMGLLLGPKKTRRPPRS